MAGQPFRRLDVEVTNVSSAYGTNVGIGGLALFNVNGKAQHRDYCIVC